MLEVSNRNLNLAKIYRSPRMYDVTSEVFDITSKCVKALRLKLQDIFLILMDSGSDYDFSTLIPKLRGTRFNLCYSHFHWLPLEAVKKHPDEED